MYLCRISTKIESRNPKPSEIMSVSWYAFRRRCIIMLRNRAYNVHRANYASELYGWEEWRFLRDGNAYNYAPRRNKYGNGYLGRICYGKVKCGCLKEGNKSKDVRSVPNLRVEGLLPLNHKFKKSLRNWLRRYAVISSLFLLLIRDVGRILLT